MMKRAIFVVFACWLLAAFSFSGHVFGEPVHTGMTIGPGASEITPLRPPEVDKHSPLGDFVMSVPWKTQGVTCDGAVDVAIEWSDAALYDISDTSGQNDGTPDPLGTVDLYVKQDSFGVWFGVINHADSAIDDFDEIGLYFDDDHDGCFPNGLTNEGNIWVYYDSSLPGDQAVWRDIRDFDCDVYTYTCLADSFGPNVGILLPCYAVGMTGGRVSYEVFVPYGTLDYELQVTNPVGMEVGFYIFCLDAGTNNYHGCWPSQGRANTWAEPCYYGDLYCEGQGEWYFKPGYPDYAPNGMPDFDQKKNGWDWPPGSGGGYYYCGPVAAANCLWWFDSKYEPGNTPPPDSSDGFPLVEAFVPGDDHDTSNVRPFIDDLAARMGTQPGVGTYIDSMEKAIDQLLMEKGLADSLEETTYWKPEFSFIEEEIERSQDVILLLGYWYWTGYEWYREGGHFVTCAGVNSDEMKIAICDPCYDNAEAGGAGWIHDGSLIPHVHGAHGPNVHDDAGNVSHDVYRVSLYSPSPGGLWWLPDFPPDGKSERFFGLNVPERFAKYQAPRPHGKKEGVHTEVEAAVVICPKEPEWYFKPDYEDYAPSGMPDFDQKQDLWDNPPGSGNWTYCGPVAVSNCFWWYDSKYQWLIDPTSPPPPTPPNDDFGFVTAYGGGDDHDTSNVIPLVDDLAWYMDTDGLRTGDGSIGTNVFEMEAAIAEWFLETETDTIFYKHTKKAPNFYWIEDEIERCEDVILLLGFWQYYGPGEWYRVGGHYVTCAGVNSDSLEIAFSDPFSDMAEMGFPGRVRDGILIPHVAGHGPEVHNDAGNVSHDYYRVVYDQLSPGGPWSIPDYPYYDDVIYSTLFANCPPEFEERQGTYNPTDSVHTEIEYAVAISPVPECWHYKGEYPDYAPDGMPDFDQNQHWWTAFCGPTAVANCLWWFDSKYQWLFDPGQPPPPYDYDGFPLVETYIAGYDDHSYQLDGAGYDNVQYLIEDLAGHMATDPFYGTTLDDMQDGIDQWLMNHGADDLLYEHTLIDSTRDPEFFDLIEEEIECCQDVILLLGFWENLGTPEDPEWWRIGGHYVTCAGVCSDSMRIMISDPDYDQQEITYPDSAKWHNNAALVSHDVYSVAPSPSPGGYWGLADYPGDIVGPRHQLQNCPDHLLPYQDYWQGTPIYTEIEAAVLVSPFVKPAAVDSLWIYTAFGTVAAGSKDLRLIWTQVTEDTAGCPAYPVYAVYRDTVPDFTPGPAKEVATTFDTTWLDVNAAGNSAINYYYCVGARAGALESASSRCVGEFDKDLVNSKKKLQRGGADIKRR
jgi:hypothetical protein